MRERRLTIAQRNTLEWVRYFAILFAVGIVINILGNLLIGRPVSEGLRAGLFIAVLACLASFIIEALKVYGIKRGRGRWKSD